MKMYLLWEWTEEHEGKMHHGIFSNHEKAKVAAETNYKKTGDHDDLPEGEFNELEWEETVKGLVGTKMGDYESDYPYEIETFEIDVYYVEEFDEEAREWKTVRHEL